MKVSIITPTGGRPEAFALCVKYMQRQTYQGEVEWVVVSDLEAPEVTVKDLPAGWSLVLVPGPKPWKEGINTQRYNLDEGLSKATGEIILIMEDDDWYHKSYVESMVHFLNFTPVVGECNAKYYNIQHRNFKPMLNYEHASLCQTGIRRVLLPYLERAIHSGELYIDIVFWKMIRAEKVPHFFFSDVNLCVGIKGMPGKMGIGVGHKPIGFTPDGAGFKLAELIGEDTELYKDYLGKALTIKNPPSKNPERQLISQYEQTPKLFGPNGGILL